MKLIAMVFPVTMLALATGGWAGVVPRNHNLTLVQENSWGIDRASFLIKPKGTIKLTAIDAVTFKPIKVTWSSKNAKVATVSASGVVTGVGPGETKIVATAPDKSMRSANAVVSSE